MRSNERRVCQNKNSVLAVAAEKLPRFAGGMNMLAPDFAVPQGHVRDITNMDVIPGGALRTREGHATLPIVAGDRCHSLYAAPGFMLHADGAELKRTTRGGVTTVASVQLGSPITYTMMPDGAVAFSDGASAIGKVFATGPAVRLSIQAPGSPRLTPVENGLLRAGRYTLALVWLGVDGEESPPSLPAAVDLLDGQGITITGIPVTPPPGAVAVRVYCSHANEASLFEAASLGVGVSTTRIDSPPDGPFLETLFEAPFPACSVIAMVAGRLVGFRGTTLYWSEPFRPGVFRPSTNFLQFPQPGSLIAPTLDGVYVGTLGENGDGEVLFLSGFEFGGQQNRQVTPYGAYPGTTVSMPNAPMVGWASPRGFVLAEPSGQVTNISQDKVVFPGASRGAAVVREKDGVRQLIASLAPSGANSPFVSMGYTEGEIIKGASIQ